MTTIDYQSIITFIMEIIGTIAFAASGAMVGAEQKMDIFGICVLGVVTSTGGGIIRDLILGITPPNMFRDPIYALVATLTSCLVFVIMYRRKHITDVRVKILYERIMLTMDSIGLGIFTVVGVNTGIHAGYINSTFLLVFLGTITGVGGGLLRDMMAGVRPYIAGAIACVYLHRSFGAVPSMVLSCLLIILIRYLAAHYRWNLPHME
jgi:uncharacterized membrane protein YeiH